MPRVPTPLAALLTALLTACPTAEPPTCDAEADRPLFGAPNAATGLTADRCGPACSCGGETWRPPTYTADDFARWRALTLREPAAPLTADPYDGTVPPDPGPDAVCAVHLDGDGSYRLADYESSATARRAGAVPTHFGRCGLCSPLADLAVYAEQPDLTELVRACGLTHLTGPPEAHMACLQDLGFTEACASIWYFNTVHTRRRCAAPCFAALNAPYHDADGSLNACLRCDEEESGPIFQAVAGRTRRNTGLASSMCRPCDEVRPLEHRYGVTTD